MRQESAGAVKGADFLLKSSGGELRNCAPSDPATPHGTQAAAGRRPQCQDNRISKTPSACARDRVREQQKTGTSTAKTSFKNVHQSSNSWQGDCEKRLICTIARPMSSWAPTTSVAPLMMLRFSSSCNEQQLRTVDCRVFRDLHGKLQAG